MLSNIKDFRVHSLFVISNNQMSIQRLGTIFGNYISCSKKLYNSLMSSEKIRLVQNLYRVARICSGPWFFAARAVIFGRVIFRINKLIFGKLKIEFQ